jgi:hypothetical protein
MFHFSHNLSIFSHCDVLCSAELTQLDFGQAGNLKSSLPKLACAPQTCSNVQVIQHYNDNLVRLKTASSGNRGYLIAAANLLAAVSLVLVSDTFNVSMKTNFDPFESREGGIMDRYNDKIFLVLSYFIFFSPILYPRQTPGP